MSSKGRSHDSSWPNLSVYHSMLGRGLDSKSRPVE